MPHVEFSRTGIGLVTTERGTPPRTLGAPVVGDAPSTARALSPSTRVEGWALYGRRGIVGVTVKRRSGRSRLEAGFGTVGRTIAQFRAVGSSRLSALTFDVDANARGTAAIAFTKDRGVYLAVRAPDGAFRPAVRVGGTAHALVGPSVSVNSRGDVLVAWTASLHGRPHRSPPHFTMARIRTRNGSLGPIQRLGPSTGFPPSLQLAFTASRRALVSWQGSGVARVAYAPAGGHFRSAQVLERFQEVSEFQESSAIRVAFGSSGRGVAVWTGGSAPARSVRAALLSGPRFGPPQVLSEPGRDANVDALAAGPRGEFVTAWTEGPFTSPSLLAATIPAGASARWGSPELIADGASSAAVAIDPITNVPFAAFTTNAGIEYSKRSPVGH